MPFPHHLLWMAISSPSRPRWTCKDPGLYLHSDFPLQCFQHKGKMTRVSSSSVALCSIAAPTQLQLRHWERLRRTIELGDLDEALALFADSQTRTLAPGVVLESMLVDSLMKSGRSGDAFRVFDQMPLRSVVTWTSLIKGCCHNGHHSYALQVFVEMLESEEAAPNSFSCNAALEACGVLCDMRIGQQLHSLILRLGFACDVWSANCLIALYSKLGDTDGAVKVFERLSNPDLVAWTSLVSGFSDCGMFDSAMGAFENMMRIGLMPNEHTVASVLTACDMRFGEQVHGFMVKTMLDRCLCPSSSLLEFYSRNNEIEHAKLVFSSLSFKTVITWCSMISCYLRSGEAKNAVEIFVEMMQSGVQPNEFVFSTVLGACSLQYELNTLGSQVHCSIIKHGLDSNNHVANALLTMYVKNGLMQEMDKVFVRLADRDVISWCLAISGYSQIGCDGKAIELFREMLGDGFARPNEFIFSSVLGSCSNLASIDLGRQVHCSSLKSGCELIVCVGNSLVNMYAKCGSINDFVRVFKLMPCHDIMSWNSLIHGYAQNGFGSEAMTAFNQMTKVALVTPDESTFVGVLTACSHMGFVERALEYFRSMQDDYGIAPSQSVYSCLVNMISRSGRLSDALDVIEHMPIKPDLSIWKALLASCLLHDDIELARMAAAKVVELSPSESASYILLSNLHAMRGEWGDCNGVRRLMEANGAMKEAGKSWIEIQNEVHTFVAGASYLTHHKAEAIFNILHMLVTEMKGDYSCQIASDICNY